MRTYIGLIGQPDNSSQILIGGTNPQGKHGLGVAKLGIDHWGAIYGCGYGLQGQFWGIVTKDLRKSYHPSVSEEHIKDQIKSMYAYASYHLELDFIVAYTGNGKNLNGYSAKQMAKMFNQPPIPNNIVFEEGFSQLIV